jgi:hypothetical protein
MFVDPLTTCVGGRLSLLDDGSDWRLVVRGVFA